MGLFAVFQVLYQTARLIRILIQRPAVRGLLAILLPFLLTGMTFFHLVEGMSWLDALYFSVVTLTSVGYGDFVPETAIGKIFTMLYIVLGIGLFIAFFTELAAAIAEDNPIHGTSLQRTNENDNRSQASQVSMERDHDSPPETKGR